MNKELNNKQIKKTLLINASLLLLFFIVIITFTNINILKFSLSGYTYKENYGSDIMYTENAIEGEKTTFIIPIKTQNEPLNELYAEIKIYDNHENPIHTLKTEKTNIKDKTESNLQTTWENNLTKGEYIVRINIYSDKSSASFTKRLLIEEKTLTIESIILSNATNEKQGNLEILLKNHLQKDINNVRTNIEFFDKENNLIKEVTINTEKINKSSLLKIDTNLQTDFIEDTNTKAKIEINAEDYKIEKEIEIQINKTQNEFNIIGTGFAINYQETENSNNKIWIILGFIALIVIINIFLFRKRKKY